MQYVDLIDTGEIKYISVCMTLVKGLFMCNPLNNSHFIDVKLFVH